MFSEKLQNPFLKSSPFFQTVSPTTHSYDSPLFSLPKYKDYFTSYQQPKLNGYSSFQPLMYQTIDAPHKDKYKAQPNIGQILSKNPFNRSFTSISHSKANADLITNEYHSNWNSRSPITYPHTTNNNSPYFSKGYEIGLPIKQSTFHISDTYPAKSLPQRKPSNYQSGSSAESAGTYINKINQIEGERPADANRTNPFYRKQLMQDRVDDKQSKPINSYDSVALKYSRQGEKDHKQIVRVNQSENAPQIIKIHKVKTANDAGQIQKRGGSIDNPLPAKLQVKAKEPKIESNEYISKYLVEEGKYKKYYQGYDQDKKYSFGSIDKAQQTFHQIDNRLPKNDNLLNRVNKRVQKEMDQNEQFDFNAPDQFQANRLMQLQGNEEEDVIKFENAHLLKNNLNSNTLEKNNAFAVLGQGVQIGSSPLQGKQLGKLTHSQVEEYQDPLQIQRKVKSRKNVQQEQVDRQGENKLIRKTPSFGQEQQNKRGEFFIQNVHHPSTIVLNGSLFHRLSVI